MARASRHVAALAALGHGAIGGAYAPAYARRRRPVLLRRCRFSSCTVRAGDTVCVGLRRSAVNAC
ncbi:hypothetical protein OH77DRAFT_1429887 [Trametes cingulata]|nr:hypothetical protein OH77DRAFT_1429887 [Trametes cingulata]